MFLLYINDLCNVSSVVESLLYADDTSLYITGSNIEEMINCMNEELVKIVEWLNINKLTLNVQKTEYIIFAPGRKKIGTSANISINGNIINRVSEIKFLGVIIDHKLLWQNHTHHVKMKVSKNIGILCKGKKIFKKSTLVTMYNSFINPYIAYCLEIWGLCAKKYSEPIIRLQKLCCRIITGVPKRTPSAPLFKMLNIVALDEMYKHSVMIIMYRFYKGMLPSVMNQIFSRKADARSHCTRQSHHINVPLCKSQVSFNSLKYQGPSIWNKYCTKVGYDCSLHTFSKRVRLLCIFNV